MPVYNDPFRRRGMSQPRPSGTSEEVQRLIQAYQALQGKAEQLNTALTAKQRELEAKQREVASLTEAATQARRELEIKNEALHRQNADMKQMEAELVWARAGVQQQEQQEQSAKETQAVEEMSWRERYVRLQSELDSLRRRWEQRFATETANSRQEILRDMLPLADHLELAIQHGEALAEDETKEYLRDIQATYQAFLNTLKRYGVTPIEAQGQPFDPNLHEAVGQTQEGDLPSGAVAQVVQTGYMDGDRLLRPARVLVRE